MKFGHILRKYFIFIKCYLNQLMNIETYARKPLTIAINIENTLFKSELKVKILKKGKI